MFFLVIATKAKLDVVLQLNRWILLASGFINRASLLE